MKMLKSESHVASVALFALAAVIIAVALFCFPGCGNANGSSVGASIIPGPAGYTCFAVSDDSGKVVGGNCLKD